LCPKLQLSSKLFMSSVGHIKEAGVAEEAVGRTSRLKVEQKTVNRAEEDGGGAEEAVG
jgi:hypothetical protein